jgi:hypothetical protein
MKIIPVKIPRVNASKAMLVDDEDFYVLSRRKWHLTDGYARTKVGKGDASAHRIVLWSPRKSESVMSNIDHINGNKLDNQKKNLRICTNAQNQWNSQRSATNKSGYKGVSKGYGGKWRAAIRVLGKEKWIGNYETPQEASEAYKNAALSMHGEFARY